MERKIKECVIIEKRWVNEIHVVYEDSDGRTVLIGTYYPDEITYDANEFIGLTGKEANDLMTKRDIEYLRK